MNYEGMTFANDYHWGYIYDRVEAAWYEHSTRHSYNRWLVYDAARALGNSVLAMIEDESDEVTR